MQARYQAAPTALQGATLPSDGALLGVGIARVGPPERCPEIDCRRAGHRRNGAPDTRRGDHKGPRVRRCSRSDDLRHLAAATRSHIQPEHGCRRRQRRSHSDAVLPHPRPVTPGAHHGVGPPVVRGLPVVRLLLPSSRFVRRRVLARVPLRRRLQARHRPRSGHAAGVRLGLRAAGRVQETYPDTDGHGQLALLVQHLLHHRRREPDLDAGR